MVGASDLGHELKFRVRALALDSHRWVLSSCTRTQGNSRYFFFVQDSLIMCGVLFGLLYRLLCTGTQGQANPSV